MEEIENKISELQRRFRCKIDSSNHPITAILSNGFIVKVDNLQELETFLRDAYSRKHRPREG